MWNTKLLGMPFYWCGEGRPTRVPCRRPYRGAPSAFDGRIGCTARAVGGGWRCGGVNLQFERVEAGGGRERREADSSFL